MLCKYYWIVLYTVHVTAFCLGGPFFSGHGVVLSVSKKFWVSVNICDKNSPAYFFGPSCTSVQHKFLQEPNAACICKHCCHEVQCHKVRCFAGLASTINILVPRRIRFHAVFLHVRHHLVGNLREYFLGKHHLTPVKVVAETASNELTKRHELQTHRNDIVHKAIWITNSVLLFKRSNAVTHKMEHFP